jgi:sodium/pantothenate symporter
MRTVGVYVDILGCLLSLIPIVGLYMPAYEPVLEQSDNAMPMYLTTFLYPGLQGLITLFIIFAMKSTAYSMLHTVASATSHDLRLALNKDAEHDSLKALKINRLAVMGLGLLMMVYAPSFTLSWLGILDSGTLLAAMIDPVFISTFWQGNVAGALTAMLVSLFTSGSPLMMTDLGWVEGSLIGAAASSVAYVAVSLLTRSSKSAYSVA